MKEAGDVGVGAIFTTLTALRTFPFKQQQLDIATEIKEMCFQLAILTKLLPKSLFVFTNQFKPIARAAILETIIAFDESKSITEETFKIQLRDIMEQKHCSKLSSSDRADKFSYYSEKMKDPYNIQKKIFGWMNHWLPINLQTHDEIEVSQNNENTKKQQHIDTTLQDFFRTGDNLSNLIEKSVEQCLFRGIDGVSLERKQQQSSLTTTKKSKILVQGIQA